MLQLVLLIFVFCFYFRNATPLLYCPPSLVKQKLKELETSRDHQEKLDQLDTQDKQDGRLLDYIKHKLNFTPDGSLAESCANLFSPALKLINEKYRIRPDFSQNTAVCNKGIIFLYVEGDLHFVGGFFISFIEDRKKSYFYMKGAKNYLVGGDWIL